MATKKVSLSEKKFSDLSGHEKEASFSLEQAGARLRQLGQDFVGSVCVHFYKSQHGLVSRDEMLELRVQCQVTDKANTDDLKFVQAARDALVKYYQKLSPIIPNDQQN